LLRLEHTTLYKASDLAGNESRETTRILIPPLGATPSPLPTRQVEPAETRIPQPQTTNNCPLMTDDCSLPALPLSPTRTPVVSAFQSPTHQAPITNSPITNHPSPAPLFGAAALTALAAATGLALAERKRRKDAMRRAIALSMSKRCRDEEARQRAEAQAEAVGLSVPKPSRRNAAEEARKAQAYLLAQIAAQQAALEQTVSHRGQDAKIERMEEAEGAALAAAKTAKPQRDEQAYQDYRAGERDAETIVADYQTRKAVQEYRAGERDVATTSQHAETVKSISDWGANIYDSAVGIAVGAYAAWKARMLQFRTLESGHISVSATTPEGTRQAYRAILAAEQNFNFKGTRYLPQTVTSRTATGLIKGAINGDAWALAGATSFILNSIEYGWGSTSVDDLANRTIKNQDFWASTAADAVVGVATGFAAAAVVGGTIVGLTALGVTAVAAVPLAVTIGVTAVVAAGIGWGLSALGVNDALQGTFNQGIDWVQSLFG